MREREIRFGQLAAVAGVAALAAALWLSGLGDSGLWAAELEAHDRVRAALGEPVTEVFRAPRLPALLQTFGSSHLGTELGLRTPGAIACVVLVLVAAWLAPRERRGDSAIPPVWGAVLAGAFIASAPGIAASARSAANPIVGESLGAAMVCTAILAVHASKHARNAWWILSGLAGTAAVASGGLPGVCAPLASVAVYATAFGRTGDATRAKRGRRIAIACAVGLALALGTMMILARGQGEGYIPLLGAAKDLDLIESPQRRSPAATLEELGHHVFPWAALVVVGAIVSRRRWAVTWLVVGVAVAIPWSAEYGPTPPGVAVPAAIVCVDAIAALLDSARPALQRRALLVAVIGGFSVQSKDLERFPARVAAPNHQLMREADFPDAATGASERLGDAARLGLLALLAGFALSRRSEDLGSEPTTIAERLPERARALLASPRFSRIQTNLPPALLAAALAAQAASARDVADDVADQLGSRSVLDRHGEWVAAGHLPPELGMHRIRDRSATFYGPPPERRVSLGTRASVADWLQRERPSVVLIRRSDYPAFVQQSRQHDWPLHVLDDAHHDLKLIANHVPPGLGEIRPLDGVLFTSDDAPTLANPTYVRFDESIEVVGWEIDGEVSRGKEVVVSLALRVVGRLPASSEIYVRMQQGELSKINPFAQPLTDGLYPPAHWRPGDIIVHRQRIEIPWVNVFPGSHELFVGFTRGKNKNASVTRPEAREGEHGVRLRGRKGRQYANLATIEVG